MRRKAYILPLAAMTVVGLATIGGLKLVGDHAERADCPGKIICPQTGELICRDKCPTVDPDREDCPGRIICPLSGELICVDRCTLKNKATVRAETNEKPPCCSSPD